MDAFSLEGRVAVVTGALGLLGREHCRALASAGAHVVAVDLDGDACRRFASDLGQEVGREVTGEALDITDREAVAAFTREQLRRHGRLDVLVNNAAIDDKVEAAGEGAGLRFEDYPLALWERSLRVNLTGAFLCCQCMGGEMARRGAGSIINVASTYGVVSPDQSLYRDREGVQTFFKSASYPTTKGGLIALTRYLATYWGRAGVRVNALSPGGVRNGQGAGFIERYAERTPLGRMANPTDYAGALVFLASEASAYMTGANLLVDGGFTAW